MFKCDLHFTRRLFIIFIIIKNLDCIYLDLLQQTLDMHPNSNIIHIGCDEVSLTYSNSQCQTTQMSTYERYIK